MSTQYAHLPATTDGRNSAVIDSVPYGLKIPFDT